jgi:hypothetical protein
VPAVSPVTLYVSTLPTLRFWKPVTKDAKVLDVETSIAYEEELAAACQLAVI